MILRRQASLPKLPSDILFSRHWLSVAHIFLFSTLIEYTPTFKSPFLSLKMPSYKTLAILALAASAASPALSAPVQGIQERALNSRELATRFGFKSLLSKVKDWNLGSKLKNLALMAAVTTGATEVGSTIFHAVSKPASETVTESGAGAASGAAESSGGAVTAPLSDASVSVPATVAPATRRTLSESHLDMLSRDDLGEALRLISRMLRVDELD